MWLKMGLNEDERKDAVFGRCTTVIVDKDERSGREKGEHSDLSTT